jgi:hypothetical protein
MKPAGRIGGFESFYGTTRKQIATKRRERPRKSGCEVMTYSPSHNDQNATAGNAEFAEGAEITALRLCSDQALRRFDFAPSDDTQGGHDRRQLCPCLFIYRYRRQVSSKFLNLKMSNARMPATSHLIFSSRFPKTMIPSC